MKKGKDNLVKRAAIRLNKFYDSILIDEFQDFREQDYELIIKLAKHLNNVLLVGDYYQHSVSGKNNTGKPFETQKRNISYIDFVNIYEMKILMLIQLHYRHRDVALPMYAIIYVAN